jgi:DNA-binding MarR family transcriptional regulator
MLTKFINIVNYIIELNRKTKSSQNKRGDFMDLKNQVIELLDLSSKFKCGLKKTSYTEAEFLFAVGATGKIKMKDLSRKLNVTPGAVTQMVDKLILKNLIRRETDFHDRRIVYVMLTEDGIKTYNDFLGCRDNLSSRILSSLDDKEKTDAEQIFFKLNKSLSEAVFNHN